MKSLSRRHFGVVMAAGLVGRSLPTRWTMGGLVGAVPSIDEILDRIRRNLGVEWASPTVDGVKAGEVSAEVTGVVTTAIATLSVLREAKERGANLVITSSPTFYSRADTPTTPPGRGGRDPEASPADPAFEAKTALIEEAGMVVFRLSDHWRQHASDPFVRGLASVVGVEAGGNVSPTTLGAMASELQRELGARGGIRVVGDRETRVRRVALLPGATSVTASLEAFPGVDAVIAGEVREWESVEYARDLVHAGRGKGLILLGRVLSENPGMRAHAEWLGTFLGEIPVHHIAAGDPYWRPGS